MRVSHERLFKSHYPTASIEYQRNQMSGGYYLVRSTRGAYMPIGEGDTKARAWRNACERMGITALKDAE